MGKGDIFIRMMRFKFKKTYYLILLLLVSCLLLVGCSSYVKDKDQAVERKEENMEQGMEGGNNEQEVEEKIGEPQMEGRVEENASSNSGKDVNGDISSNSDGEDHDDKGQSDNSDNQDNYEKIRQYNLRYLELIKTGEIEIPELPPAPDFNTDGFASSGMRTTGGEGASAENIFVVTTLEELIEVLDARSDIGFEKNNPPAIIYIKGNLISNTSKLAMIKVIGQNDLSIIGLGRDASLYGCGLKIANSHNIVVRNITFYNCPDDAICIEGENTHHIWIDHNTFTDYPSNDPKGLLHDGQVDIKYGASFITVSWNHFKEHSKVSLVGHSPDNAAQDTGKLKVTYHHNWFEGTVGRHPRVRFGQVHVYNNLYTDISDYGIGATCSSHILVEANHFHNVALPILISQVNGNLSDDPPGFVKIIDNYLTGENGEIIDNLSQYNFDPKEYYDYTVDDPKKIAEIIKQKAGAGKW